MSIFRRRGNRGEGESSERILVIGLGNPGPRYERTRHNVGFEIAVELGRRWEMPKPRQRYGGLISEGRTEPGGPRVALLQPLTYMNESGSAAGPARGELRAPLDHVVALHDEIDLEFGTIRVRLGGGLAGHNGLKSLRQGLGGTDFWRVRAGVGRPDSSDPEVVSAYVLSRFAEPREDVEAMIADAAGEAERLVARIAAGEASSRTQETEGG